MDTATASVIVAVITGVSAFGVAWLQRPAKKLLLEAHREVTVNGGKNNPPTLKDEVGSLKAGQERIGADVTALVGTVETLAERQDATNQRLDAHLTQSAMMDARLIDLETEFQAAVRRGGRAAS